MERIKPNLAAPGVNVRSSIPGGGYAAFNGTSMASPHTAGTVALMWSAAPSLIGDLAQTAALLNQTAVDTNDLTCGGTAANNNVWGEGKLDAFAAVEQSPRGPVGTLNGTVTNASSGAPLAGAQVNVTGPVEPVRDHRRRAAPTSSPCRSASTRSPCRRSASTTARPR